MVVMFRLNQAALLFAQLLVMCSSGIVFAASVEDHRVMLVSRGDPAVMTCNLSTTNVTEISWTKGRSGFKHSIPLNRTISNFSCYRLKISHELPSKLIIFTAEPEDEGLYTCNITHRFGLYSSTWNLTVSENLKGSIPVNDLLFILLPAIGFLVCGIVVTFFLCRKIRRRSPTRVPVQTPRQPEETALPRSQGGTAHRENNKRRSQYMERLNSIYDQF